MNTDYRFFVKSTTNSGDLAKQVFTIISEEGLESVIVIEKLILTGNLEAHRNVPILKSFKDKHLVRYIFSIKLNTFNKVYKFLQCIKAPKNLFSLIEYIPYDVRVCDTDTEIQLIVNEMWVVVKHTTDSLYYVRMLGNSKDINVGWFEFEQLIGFFNTNKESENKSYNKYNLYK